MAANKKNGGWFRGLRDRLRRTKKIFGRLHAEMRPTRLAEQRNRKHVINATVKLLLGNKVGTAKDRLQSYLNTLSSEEQRRHTVNRVGRELATRLNVPLAKDLTAEMIALNPYRRYGGKQEWVQFIPEEARKVGERVARELNAFQGILSQGQSLVVYLKKMPDGRGVFRVSFGYDRQRFHKVYEWPGEQGGNFNCRVWLEGKALNVGRSVSSNR